MSVNKEKQLRPSSFFKYLFLILGCLVIAAPLYVTIITAFKTREESTVNFFSFPSQFYLGNFREIIEKQNYFRYLGNTVIITVCSLILMALVIPSLSYALSRNMRRSKFYRFSYIYLVIGLFVPFQVVMIPLVKIASSFHMSNIWGLIVLNLVFALRDGVFLFVACAPGAGGECVYRRGRSGSDVYPDRIPSGKTHDRHDYDSERAFRLERLYASAAPVKQIQGQLDAAAVPV